MSLGDNPAFFNISPAANTCSASKFGPFDEPLKMTCVELLPSVSTMAERPCLVTERKVCPDPAALIASTAMSIEPSLTDCRESIGVPRGRRKTHCAVFEAHAHRECAGEFSMYLRFSGSRSDGTPCAEVREVLWRDDV